jgi:hypothetical protein
MFCSLLLHLLKTKKKHPLLKKNPLLRKNQLLKNLQQKKRRKNEQQTKMSVIPSYDRKPLFSLYL